MKPVVVRDFISGVASFPKWTRKCVWGYIVVVLLCWHCLSERAAFAQFQAGTLLDLDSDIETKYEWEDIDLVIGTNTIKYSRSGSFKVNKGTKVLITRNGAGILSSLDHSEGAALINETITFNNTIYQRVIRYDDGATSVTVTPQKEHLIADGCFVDLSLFYPVVRYKRPIRELVNLLNDKQWEVKAGAIVGLKEAGATEELIKALKHADYAVQVGAIAALGDIKAKASVPALALKLKDEHWSTRWRAARSLKLIKDPLALPDLVATLDDENEMVRNQCTKALSAISGEDFGADRSKWDAWLKAHKPKKAK